MNQIPKLLYVPTRIACLILFFGGVLTATATTVYFNDFSGGAASLNGLSVVDQSLSPYSASVSVESGQLRLDATYWTTYIVANASSFAAPYSTILKNNPGTVTWAFNVSNMDDVYANGFFFCPASDTRGGWGYYSSYILWGNGGGNPMQFYRTTWYDPPPLLLQIPSSESLDTLPSKGSFRITYEPSSDLWSLFGHIGLDYIDPTTVTTLMGSVVDSSFTSMSLPYMEWGGADMGSDFFDNISVSVIPEPATSTLALLAVATSAVLRLRQAKARRHSPLRLSND
jgi:hypothetical protein